MFPLRARGAEVFALLPFLEPFPYLLPARDPVPGKTRRVSVSDSLSISLRALSYVSLTGHLADGTWCCSANRDEHKLPRPR